MGSGWERRARSSAGAAEAAPRSPLHQLGEPIYASNVKHIYVFNVKHMMAERRYRVKVHGKGLIVIPAEVRRRFGIVEGSYLELLVEEDRISIMKPTSLREAFGADGERALEVARLINASRRLELESEVRP